MFDCTTCGKSYSTKNSLNRHAKNHQPTTRHVCSNCGLSFRRRDLLSRHRKIHSQRADHLLGVRVRCHTACIQCRQSRIRCDGREPCSACVWGKRRCVHSATTRRQSQRLAPCSLSDGVSSEEIIVEHCHHSGEANVDLMENTKVAALASVVPMVTDIFSENILKSLPSSALDEQDSNSKVLEDIIVDPFTWSTEACWPWLHENMFLLDNSQNALGVSPIVDTDLDIPSSTRGWEFTSTLESHRSVLESMPTSDHLRSKGTTLSVQDSQPSMSSKDFIKSVTDEAIGFSKGTGDRYGYWKSVSDRIQLVFPSHITAKPLLEKYLDLYFEHFQPLWPLISLENLRYESLNPTLYLTLISIGAMYHGKEAKSYGTIMHECIRSTLAASPFMQDESEDTLISLGQSLLLTQVAALYFGQSKAFSYAQHLGGILVAQARKMNLFSALNRSGVASATAANSAASWKRIETRKRLAFGILRAETFMSILLNTRPHVSYEEINLALPCSDVVWMNGYVEAEKWILAGEANIAGYRDTYFSDLVRIALDRGESLPVLQPGEYEMLLFGLQQSVWNFSHDPRMIERLTGMDEQVDPTEPDVAKANEDVLDYSKRSMGDLLQDNQRTISALQKWKQSFASGQSALQLQRDRSALLSSLLLYNLSFLRLYAPIENLHQVAYRLDDTQSETELIDRIYLWSRGRRAKLALEYACSIWNLIAKELDRPIGHRARFNILTLIGLHHAAVVVWSYAGTHKDGVSLASDKDDCYLEKIRICHQNSQTLTESFASLIDRVSPAWGIQSSFFAAAQRMAKSAFPFSD